MAAAPAPTSAGVFGIARTTRRRPPTARSMACVVTPAATETGRSAPASATAAAGIRDVGRLDGQHRPPRGSDREDARMRSRELIAAR